MAHYLFTQWDGGGSLPPELTVVRRLVEAGHTVTVLGEPVTEAEVRAVGVEDFRPWVDVPHHVTRRAEDDYIRDWERRTPLGVLASLMDTLMVTPAPRFAAETLAVIDDVRPDVVASSFPLFGALLAAEARRVPCAVLVPNVVALPAEGMPPFGTGLLPAEGAARAAARPGAERARRSAVEQGPPRAEPDACVARPGATRPAAGPVRAGRPGPRAHGRGVRLPRRAARQRPLRRPPARRSRLGRVVDPAGRRRPPLRAGGHEHDVHGSRRPAPAGGHRTGLPARPGPGDDRTGRRSRADPSARRRDRRAFGSAPRSAGPRRRAGDPRRSRHGGEGARGRRADRVHAHRTGPARQRRPPHRPGRGREGLEEGVAGQGGGGRAAGAGRSVVPDRRRPARRRRSGPRRTAAPRWPSSKPSSPAPSAGGRPLATCAER